MITMGRPQLKRSPYMKTVGLMLQLTILIYSTGKAVILDSGLCVLKVILEVSKKRFYGSSLIKKSLYWTRGVHGDGINKYFRVLKLVMWDVLVVNRKGKRLMFLC